MSDENKSAERVVLQVLFRMRDAALNGGGAVDYGMPCEFRQGQAEAFDAAIRVIGGIFDIEEEDEAGQ